MRVSTGMIYDAGVSSMGKQTSTLLQLENQLSSGLRVVTPADDPVAAARALLVTQAQDITTQYSTNLSNATSALGLSDSVLSNVSDLLNHVRELAVQAGSSILSNSDRTSIAQELRSNFDQLVGLANSTDGSGQYLFSGYMGSTKPFSGSVDSGVTYAGDNGQRLLQVSASRQLAVSDSGASIFDNIPTGNGYFVTAYSSANTGSGIIDGGTVTNPAAWNASARNFTIQFSVSGATTAYTVLNGSGATVSTGTYSSGSPISIPGGSVTISGSPANGDSFSINPGTSQSVFATLQNLIKAVEVPQTGTPSGLAALSSQIGTALTNIDQATSNILSVRTTVGARQNEVTALGNSNSSLGLQYQQTLSNLQDLDYTKAISDLTRGQTGLTAAQKAFQAVTGLSLFNYL